MNASAGLLSAIDAVRLLDDGAGLALSRSVGGLPVYEPDRVRGRVLLYESSLAAGNEYDDFIREYPVVYASWRDESADTPLGMDMIGAVEARLRTNPIGNAIVSVGEAMADPFRGKNELVDLLKNKLPDLPDLPDFKLYATLGVVGLGLVVAYKVLK